MTRPATTSSRVVKKIHLSTPTRFAIFLPDLKRGTDQGSQKPMSQKRDMGHPDLYLWLWFHVWVWRFAGGSNCESK